MPPAPGACKVYFEVSGAGMPQPVRLHARTSVEDLTPELTKSPNRLLHAEHVVLESEA